MAGGLLLGFPTRKRLIKEAQLELSLYAEATVVVFPAPSCPWGYMFQRPQQLAKAFARRGILVLYSTDTSFSEEPDWSVRGIKQLDNYLYLYNDNHMGKYLPEILEGKNVIVWQYWPHQFSYVRTLASKLSISLVYDVIDHLTTFDGYPGMENDHNDSLSNAIITVATAKQIYNEIAKSRSNCLLLPNAVNTNDFKSVGKSTQNVRKIIGYYGAVAEWFDFEAIEFSAINNPDWTFKIVGEIYSQVTRDVERLKLLPNVEFCPRISYDRIPELLSSFDVSMLPFRINDITLNTSPVKVYEYLAGGKVTVSSPLPEVLDLPGVLIASSAEEFEKQLHHAFQVRNDSALLGLMRHAAEQNSWERRVEQFLEHLSYNK